MNWLFQEGLKGNFMVYSIYIGAFNEQNILFSNTRNEEFTYIYILFSSPNITCISSLRHGEQPCKEIILLYTGEICEFGDAKKKTKTFAGLRDDFISNVSK